MSHTLAARCTVCGLVDDPTCPECGTPSSTTHGTTDQVPFTTPPDLGDGYVHEWHPQCLTQQDDRATPMSAPETLPARLAKHQDEPGWTDGRTLARGLVYECSCGDQSPVLAYGFISEQDVEAAAAWWYGHLAAVVADWLTEDAQTKAAARAINAADNVAIDRSNFTYLAAVYAEQGRAATTALADRARGGGSP